MRVEPHKPGDVRFEDIGWAIKVHFRYVAEDGSYVGGPCWRLEPKQ